MDWNKPIITIKIDERWWLKQFARLLAVVIVCYLVYTGYLQLQIRQARQALRAMGAPMTQMELAAMQPADVKAEEYRAAFALLPEDYSSDNAIWEAWDSSLPTGAPFPMAYVDACRDYVATNRPALDKLLGASGDGVRYGFKVTINDEGHEALIVPHIGLIRRSAQLINYHQQINITEADAAGYVRGIAALSELARTLEREPTGISQLVMVSVVAVMIGSLEEAAPRMSFTDAQLGVMIDTLAQFDYVRSIHLQALGWPHGYELAHDNPKYYGCTCRHGWWISRTHSRLNSLRLSRDILAYCQNPGWPIPDFEATALAMRGMNEVAVCSGKAQQMNIGDYFQAQARRRVTIAALAAQRYLIRHGRRPDSIEQLAPLVPEGMLDDPFAPGQRLKLKREPFGLTAYSIGNDSHDDGGRRYNDDGYEFKEGTDLVAYAFTQAGPQPGIETPPEDEE